MRSDDDTPTDRLYTTTESRIDDFDFGAETAAVFDDMLNRSVPLYGEIQRMVGELAGDFAVEGTKIYDLGCSTCNTFLAIAHHLPPGLKIPFVGVDSSEEMLDKARAKLQKSGCPYPYELRTGDLDHGLIVDNCIVVMSLTLQFVRPLLRDRLLQAVHQGLNRNGCLILIEKVLAEHSVFNRLFIKHYYEMKKRYGYSDLEIARKREALENVLIPYRRKENEGLLQRVGFQHVDTFFHWYNCSGVIAVK